MSAENDMLDKKIRTAKIEINLTKVELARKEKKLFDCYVERFGMEPAKAMMKVLVG